MSTPAGWYPDPNRSQVDKILRPDTSAGIRQRYWDGTAWTDQTRLPAPAPAPQRARADRNGWPSPLLWALGSAALVAILAFAFIR